LFAWRFLKVSIFSCKSVGSQLVDIFNLRTLSVCQEWFLVLGDDLIREVYHQDCIPYACLYARSTLEGT
jgi:hypothetical protein